MSTNAGTVASFLRSKGLSDNAIAGVLGNLQVESGISPTSANPTEGAIGLAQWEKGRRGALDSYAAAHGGKETDLATQLGFMWSELTGQFSGVLTNLKGASSPAQAATIWDTQYEKSAGTTRTERIAAANGYAKNIPSAGPSGLADLASWTTPAGILGHAASGTVSAGASVASGASGLSNIGNDVTKAGVYLLAFGLGGVLLVLGLNKAAGNPAGKAATETAHLAGTAAGAAAKA